MEKKLLIDAAHPEETRVVVAESSQTHDFDFESNEKTQITGNIYLAKVTRVEPSLQAAFLDYGGNRHGFLAFSEIHPDYYRIPVEDRKALTEEMLNAEDTSLDEVSNSQIDQESEHTNDLETNYMFDLTSRNALQVTGKCNIIGDLYLNSIFQMFPVRFVLPPLPILLLVFCSHQVHHYHRRLYCYHHRRRRRLHALPFSRETCYL